MFVVLPIAIRLLFQVDQSSMGHVLPYDTICKWEGELEPEREANTCFEDCDFYTHSICKMSLVV
jgi:hypothetical protein